MKRTHNPFSDETADLRESRSYAAIAILGLFFLLLLRLWYLQIIRGPEFRSMSESNRTRIQDIIPPRGVILDRQNHILVDNYPSYELAVIREDVSDITALTRRLSFLLDLPRQEIYDRFEKIKKRPAFKPTVIFNDLNRDDLATLETYRYEMPGLVIQVKPQRHYIHELLASHVIGYTGEVTQKQLKNDKYKRHRMGDSIGQFGVEKQWEVYLQGRRGQRLVEVDVSGRVIKVLDQVNPVPGYSLYLTLDTQLQEAAQAALAGRAGAVVALDPNTGEVLAMASSPAFSQNDFIRGITPDRWRDLISNPLKPLQNRAVSGKYPPGSTFKIIAAVAALEEGVVTPETKIHCSGRYPLGNRTFHCWKKTGHGAVNIHRALKESCDVYFYEVGLRLGVDTLARYARAFGLGSPTGVGLANEKAGLVPSTKWKKKRFGESWQKGETLSVVIGQGFNEATPLQMAQVVALAANGGKFYQPHLVRQVKDADGQTIKTFEPELVRDLHFSPTTKAVLHQALTAAVNEPHGTGIHSRLDDILVAGKTGTSQVVNLKHFSGSKGSEVPYEFRDHAWFVAFAPVEQPRIALAVVLEHSGHGGSTAGPVAKRVLEAFFHPERQKLLTANLPPTAWPDTGD